jgi:hypothetical protein
LIVDGATLHSLQGDCKRLQAGGCRIAARALLCTS